MLIDTHSHYNLEPFFDTQQKDNWKPFWKKAQDSGIHKSIVVGTDFISSTIASTIAQQDKGLFASIGCHPNNYHEDFLNAQAHKVSSFDSLFEDLETDLEELELIIGDKKVVAIGETGLDYYRLTPEGEERTTVIQLQKQAFEKHIELSKKFDLPLILHVRDKDTPEDITEGNAYWDALKILQKHNVEHFTLHCASGPLSYIKAALELGAYIGFDGNITYPNAQAIRDIFNMVPVSSRLVETDAPFLPPQEFRGKRCEPWMLVKTVEYLERELNADPASFAKNAERLFNI